MDLQFLKSLDYDSGYIYTILVKVHDHADFKRGGTANFLREVNEMMKYDAPEMEVVLFDAAVFTDETLITSVTGDPFDGWVDDNWGKDSIVY